LRSTKADDQGFGATFLQVCAIVGAYNIAYVWVERFVLKPSVDLKGWWPWLLVILLLATVLHALVFALITLGVVGSKKRFAVGLNLLLVLVLFIRSVLYHWLPVNWGAVNRGELELTVLQKFLRSDVAFWLPYGVVWVVAGCWVLVCRHRAKA
jgi:hypothetical protein